MCPARALPSQPSISKRNDMKYDCSGNGLIGNLQEPHIGAVWPYTFECEMAPVGRRNPSQETQRVVLKHHAHRPVYSHIQQRTVSRALPSRAAGCDPQTLSVGGPV